MKKLIAATALTTLCSLALPVWAADPHAHQSPDQAPAVEQQTMTTLDSNTGQLRDMREKIEKETDPAKRMEMMQQHMKMMREGMAAMKMPMDKSAMNMPMGKGGMMGGMMGGPAGGNDPRMQMMEKRMGMMEEIMNGMMMQQELMQQKK